MLTPKFNTYTMHLGDNQDTTYTASPTFQWAFGEITCLLLVFTVPWVPRALAGRSKLETASSSLPERSWSRIHRAPYQSLKSALPSLFSFKRTDSRSAVVIDLDNRAMAASQSHGKGMDKGRESDVWAASVELVAAKPVYNGKLGVSTKDHLEMTALDHSGHIASNAITRWR